MYLPAHTMLHKGFVKYLRYLYCEFVVWPYSEILKCLCGCVSRYRHNRYIRCIQLNTTDPKLSRVKFGTIISKAVLWLFCVVLFLGFFPQLDFGNNYSREVLSFLTTCRGRTLDIWASNAWSEKLFLSLCFFQYNWLFLTFLLIHRVLKSMLPLT